MASAVTPDIFFIIGRCNSDDKFEEYIIKFVKRLLNSFAITYKKKRSMAMTMEKEWNHIQAHKRGSYVEAIRGILGVAIEKTQSKIKFTVLLANMNVRNMLARNARVSIKESPNIVGFMAILKRFGDPEALAEDFITNFDPGNGENKDEEDFMYGAHEDPGNYPSENPNYGGHRDGSLDSSGSLPRKLRMRQIKSKKIKLLKKMPTKQELYSKAREKGVTIDALSYGQLQKYKQKIFVRKQCEESNKAQYEQKMVRQEKFLRDHLEKRRLELGVPSGYQSNAKEETPVEDGYLYPFGLYEKNKKNFEKELGLPKITLYDLENADPNDSGAIQAALKRYKRLFNNLFHKYANCFTNPIGTLEFDD